MSCYLYGFVESKEEKDCGIAAVTGKPFYENWEGLSKEQLIPALLQHQRTLENIMKIQFILPCKFSTLLKDETEVQEVLAQNADFLKRWIDKMKNRCELEVVATWNPQEILREIATEDSEISKLKTHFSKLSIEEQEKNKLAVGARLSTRLKEQANHYAKYILSKLEGASKSHANHPLMNDAMVFNASFLLDRGEEEAVLKILEVLDKHFEGKLNFKCVGPLSPYSFAMIRIKRFDPEQIVEACQTLGLNGETNLKKVQQAYKSKAKHCHPDTHPDFSQKEFENIHRAYKILMDYYQGGSKPIQLSLLDASKENR